MSLKPNHARIYRLIPPFMRQLRDNAGLTQRDLAARLKRSQWWVARIETGSRRLDIAEFMEFCQGCDMDPEKVLKQLREQRGT